MQNGMLTFYISTMYAVIFCSGYLVRTHFYLINWKRLVKLLELKDLKAFSTFDF